MKKKGGVLPKNERVGRKEGEAMRHLVKRKTTNPKGTGYHWGGGKKPAAKKGEEFQKKEKAEHRTGKTRKKRKKNVTVGPWYSNQGMFKRKKNKKNKRPGQQKKNERNPFRGGEKN